MDRLLQLNLINLLTFYYSVMFCAGTWRRFKQYGELGKLLVSCPKRWPRLLKVVSQHRTIFLTWPIAAPALLALLLTLLQWLASQILMPGAELTVVQLFEPPLAFFTVPVVLALAASVLAVDIYFLATVGDIERPMLEKYFDQAEYWLASPAAHVVNIVTLGIVNPRRMVSVEVQKSLVEAGNLASNTFRWVSLQLGLRFAFGLSLWLTYALHVFL